MGLLPGERLWKLYCFRAADHPTGLRHCLYTKQKADGRLELITFAAHNPQLESTDDPQRATAPVVRSALVRVPDLSANDLHRLITAMRAKTSVDACEEIDLTIHPNLGDQVAWLQTQGNS